MNVRSLVKGLKYRGEAEGKRQTYYVFEGSGYFFVISFRKTDTGSGNFNVIESDAVQYVQRKFAGEKAITAQDLYNRSSKTRHFGSKLDALNTLYKSFPIVVQECQVWNACAKTAG
jgi:hypothetical protein